MGRWVGCLLVAVMVAVAGAAAARDRIVYNRNSQSDNDPRPAYSIGLLKLALEKADYPAELVQSPIVLEQSRSIEELAAGRTLRVIWTGTNPERERLLRPVRIPIDRGLLGVRLLMVRPDMVPRIVALPDVTHLRALIMGQGIGWPDVDILSRGGFEVVASSYDTLFTLLERGRIEGFPRASFEIRAEIAAQGALGRRFAVAPRFAVTYKFTSFFFTNRQDEALASAIERGLERAYADGSFMEYFRQHPYTRDVVEALALADREVLAINNHLLTPETRALPDRYWEFP